MTVRKRPLVHLSLSPEAIARLAEIATRCGETRSGMVERLVREAEMPTHGRRRTDMTLALLRAKWNEPKER